MKFELDLKKGFITLGPEKTMIYLKTKLFAKYERQHMDYFQYLQYYCTWAKAINDFFMSIV
jgi:hypothetical protein